MRHVGKLDTQPNEQRQDSSRCASITEGFGRRDESRRGTQECVRHVGKLDTQPNEQRQDSSRCASITEGFERRDESRRGTQECVRHMLNQDVFHHFAEDIGEAEIAAGVAVGELRVIDAHLV